MANSIFASPISLKQIAVLIKRMSEADRQQLLTLVPELRRDAMRTKRTVEDARQTVQALQVDWAPVVFRRL